VRAGQRLRAEALFALRCGLTGIDSGTARGIPSA
jgi:hypothetical protein